MFHDTSYGSISYFRKREIVMNYDATAHRMARSDRDELLRVAKHNDSVREEIVEFYMYRVLHISTKLCSDTNILQDVIQDGMVALIEAIDKMINYYDPDLFHPTIDRYIRTTVKRSLKKYSYQLVEEPFEILDDIGYRHELNIIDNMILHDYLMDLVDRLTPTEKTVIMCRYGLTGDEPMDIEDIGKLLGCLPTSVKNTELSALKKLRDRAIPKPKPIVYSFGIMYWR